MWSQILCAFVGKHDERSESFGAAWPGASEPAGIAEKASAVASAADTAAALIRVFDAMVDPIKSAPGKTGPSPARG
jgi:hypothetical protein